MVCEAVAEACSGLHALQANRIPSLEIKLDPDSSGFPVGLYPSAASSSKPSDCAITYTFLITLLITYTTVNEMTLKY